MGHDVLDHDQAEPSACRRQDLIISNQLGGLNRHHLVQQQEPAGWRGAAIRALAEPMGSERARLSAKASSRHVAIPARRVPRRAHRVHRVSAPIITLSSTERFRRLHELEVRVRPRRTRGGAPAR